MKGAFAKSILETQRQADYRSITSHRIINLNNTKKESCHNLCIITYNAYDNVIKYIPTNGCPHYIKAATTGYAGISIL